MNQPTTRVARNLAYSGYAGATTFAVTILLTDWNGGPLITWSLTAAVVLLMVVGTALQARGERAEKI